MEDPALNELLNLVDRQFLKVKNHADDPPALLQIANNLSTLLYNVGDYFVEAVSIADSKEAAMKDAYDNEYIKIAMGDEKVTQGRIEVSARIAIRGYRDEYLKVKTTANRLKTLRSDMERKVSVLQSYASEVRARMTFRPGQ